MKLNKSNTTVLILTLLFSHSLYAKKKSSNGGDFSYPPANNSQIMKFHPETGEFDKEIPIIDTYLDDGLHFKYSLYINKNGQITTPELIPMNYDGEVKAKTVGFLRDDEGQLNTITFPFHGGFGVSNTHYSGTINESYAYSIYSSNGFLYTGDYFNATDDHMYSPHKKSSVTFSYGDARRILRPGTNDNLCSGGIGGIYVSEISLSNGYKLDFNINVERIYRTNQRGTRFYVCTSATYTGLKDNQGRIWSWKYGLSPFKLNYPDGRKIVVNYDNPKTTDINGVVYSGSANSHTYSGANLDATLKTTFSGDSYKTNNTVSNLDGSIDKYIGYPRHYPGWSSPAYGTYKEHQKLDKSGKVIYDEVNTWAHNSNNTPYLTKQVITQDGVTVTKEFDGFDKYLFPSTMTETSSDGKARTTTFTYQEIQASATHGHMIKPLTTVVKDSNDKVISSITNNYDSEGYLVSTVNNGVKTDYTYDSNGNLATVTDANGNTTKYQTYQYGKPTIVIDPKGNKTTYSYDYRGLILSDTDAKGNTTTYTYDVNGRPTSITPPAGFATSYTYSSNGLTVTKKQGTVTTVTNYDGLGRMLNSTTSSSTGSVAKVTKYDTLNNKVFMSYPCTSASECKTGDIYTYDLLGRPTQLVKDTSSF
jgi:YD repeat-containing protein